MITWVSILLALIGLCSLPSEGFAQKKYALLVGVNEYNHEKLPRLRFAVNDALKMGEVLEKNGYKVIYLTDTQGKKPTKANIDATIDELIEGFKAKDTLIIGFAGHGTQDPKTKEFYFYPSDGLPFPDKRNSQVSLGNIWNQLGKTYTGTKLVLIDACRDDGTGQRASTESIPPPPKGVGVLMSCSDGQYAQEHATLKHGVFFHHVIEGLNGAAKDGDNEVTWDDLRKYVKKEVPKKINQLFGEDSGVKQNPNEMGNLTEVPVLVKLGGTTPKIEPKVIPIQLPMVAPKVESGDPKAGEERTFEVAKGVKMKFCWIPGGKATLGSPKSTIVRQPPFADKAEHSFETKAFWLGKFEVTQAEWEGVMGNNPSYFKGANLPVEKVSWEDCQEFIKKCGVRGFKVQLPHEDQWEYACRGGKGNKQAFYWGDTLNGDKANCDGNYPYGTDKKGNSLKKTTEVGSYEKVAPHPWNLCDMSGNVDEWCDNLDTDGSYRVVRGGNALSQAWFCRSGQHYGLHRTFNSQYQGFRLALVP